MSPVRSGPQRAGCCAGWPKPCSYHEGFLDGWNAAKEGTDLYDSSGLIGAPKASLPCDFCGHEGTEDEPVVWRNGRDGTPQVVCIDVAKCDQRCLDAEPEDD